MNQANLLGKLEKHCVNLVDHTIAMFLKLPDQPMPELESGTEQLALWLKRARLGHTLACMACLICNPKIRPMFELKLRNCCKSCLQILLSRIYIVPLFTDWYEHRPFFPLFQSKELLLEVVASFRILRAFRRFSDVIWYLFCWSLVAIFCGLLLKQLEILQSL